MADSDCDNLDSWENQADSGELDKRLDEMSLELQSKEVNMQNQASVMSEDTSRSQYQPQVRILRRDGASQPSKNKNKSGSSSGPGSSKFTKSLQQREQEYAQARQRIFGSLPSPEDEASEKPNDVPDPAKSGPPQIVGIQSAGPQMAIVRQPKGPDGTSGFKQDLT